MLIPVLDLVFGRFHGEPGISQVQEIRKACEAMHRQLGGLPTMVVPRPDKDRPADEERSRKVIRELAHPEQGGKVWLDPEDVTADGTFLDPWGRQYLILFDDNGDGIYPYGPGVRLGTNQPVLVVSRGPNHRLDGPGGDDVTHYRPNR